MTAYYPTTIGAAPLGCFLFQEAPNTILFCEFEVLYHAHVVFGSVTLIEGSQPAAGEVPAFITEPYKSFPNQVTMLFHKNAILAARQAASAVCPPESFLVQVILHREVADAYSAIHPTGGN